MGEALGGLQLEVEQTEVYAGNFQLDILAKEVATNKVVVTDFTATDEEYAAFLHEKGYGKGLNCLRFCKSIVVLKDS